MKVLCVTSRSCSVLLDPEGLYESREKRTLFLNGEEQGEEYRSVTSLFDLEPDTEYTLESRGKDGQAETLADLQVNRGRQQQDHQQEHSDNDLFPHASSRKR